MKKILIILGIIYSLVLSGCDLPLQSQNNQKFSASIVDAKEKRQKLYKWNPD